MHSILAENDKKKVLPDDRTFLLPAGAGYGRELEIVLNVLPILGPSKRMTAMTTMATSARMIAYSTRPWPFSFGANNIAKLLSYKLRFSQPEDLPQYWLQDISPTQKLQFSMLAIPIKSYPWLNESSNSYGIWPSL